MSQADTHQAQDGESLALQDGQSRALQDGESRALVVITARDEASPSRSIRRPNAAFLAQMMASKAHMGEFRRYRRSEPGIATAQYRAAAALVDGPKGLRISA
jgi:hypothetical protein